MKAKETQFPGLLSWGHISRKLDRKQTTGIWTDTQIFYADFPRDHLTLDAIIPMLVLLKRLYTMKLSGFLPTLLFLSTYTNVPMYIYVCLCICIHTYKYTYIHTHILCKEQHGHLCTYTGNECDILLIVSYAFNLVLISRPATCWGNKKWANTHFWTNETNYFLLCCYLQFKGICFQVSIIQCLMIEFKIG